MQWAFAFALLFPVAVWTLAPAEVPAALGADAEWLKLETAWNEAHVKGDADALDKLWDTDVVFTVSRMPPMDKSSAMAMWKSGKMSFRKYETSDVKARVFSDSAVVTGRLVRERTMQGKELKDNWRFTKVYVRRAGAWKVVAWHASEAENG